MANSLLDFVMALVRDPAAAAHYAADPAQALADAHLVDVTSADVQNLLPVVAESLSIGAPSHGLAAFGAEPVVDTANVWASGAATAAFDAFDDQVPGTSVIDDHAAVGAVVDDVDEPLDLLSGAQVPDVSTFPQVGFDDAGFDDGPTAEVATDEGWNPSVPSLHSLDHAPDLDPFD